MQRSERLVRMLQTLTLDLALVTAKSAINRSRKLGVKLRFRFGANMS